MVYGEAQRGISSCPIHPKRGKGQTPGRVGGGLWSEKGGRRMAVRRMLLPMTN